MTHPFHYCLRIAFLCAVTVLGAITRFADAEPSQFVVAANVVPTEKDVTLHVRVTYNGQGPIDVYGLFTSSVRIISAGHWQPIPPPARHYITGVGTVWTKTLNKSEYLEADYPLRSLFQSVKEGTNQFEVEVEVWPVNEKKPIVIRHKVSANLTAKEAALVNNPPASPSPR